MQLGCIPANQEITVRFEGWVMHMNGFRVFHGRLNRAVTMRRDAAAVGSVNVQCDKSEGSK